MIVMSGMLLLTKQRTRALPNQHNQTEYQIIDIKLSYLTIYSDSLANTNLVAKDECWKVKFLNLKNKCLLCLIKSSSSRDDLNKFSCDDSLPSSVICEC